MLRMICGLAALCMAAFPAKAQHDPYPDVERPLYPELVIPVDDSFSSDARLLGLREAVTAASGALVRTPDGEVYDPEPMMKLLADEVELFVGRQRTPFQEEFMFIGRQPAAAGLEIVGRLSRGADGANPPVVQQRYGIQFLGGLAREPTVGRSVWLDGRICTASYGRLEWPVWSSLWSKLRFFDKEDWRIAVVTHPARGELPLTGWPKRYQMVPVSPQQKRSGGTIGIVAPGGDTVFFDAWFEPGEGYFATYLNDHLCFEKQGDEWKVSAVAIRLD
jgi:hypothetical protein